MGFCRRCGDIVSGPRCKCGGTPVAPVVDWNPGKDPKEDRWSRTYVSRDKPPAVSSQTTGGSPTKRFPTSTPLGSRVSAHIAYTTSQLNRPPSPLKHSTTLPDSEAGILPSPHNSVLSKVYGSVLQPKESLSTHSCAICSSVFPPDATIYPDPVSCSNDRFLCKVCFISNGGSKGDCPTCARPVLTLKTEGGFVHAAGQFWHKRCFSCEGCFKNIGDKPMVDLLGRPSCADCFDNCLKRDRTPQKRASTSISNSPRRDNLGGTNTAGKGSTQSSPTIDELEQRLGILKRRETTGESPRYSRGDSPSSPSLRGRQEVDHSPSPKSRYETGITSPRQRHNSSSGTNSPAPLRRVLTGNTASPGANEDAIEEMKRRFLGESPTPPASSAPAVTPRRSHRASTSLSSSASRIPVASPSGSARVLRSSASIPSTPDLVPDFSDTATQSSYVDSPPRSNDRFDNARVSTHGRGNFLEDQENDLPMNSIPTPPSSPPKTFTPMRQPAARLKSPQPSPITIPPTISANSTCAKCRRVLFALQDGGRFVTVPNDSGSGSQIYHPDCFTCVVCDGPFKGKEQAAFVKGPDGPCHVDCCPPTSVTFRTVPGLTSNVSDDAASRRTSTMPTSAPSWSKPAPVYSSSRYDRPPLTAPSTSAPTGFPRFGSSNSCPGCQKSVSPMEFGVVPGPQGTRWHASCLVCGGKKEVVMTKWGSRATAERKKGEPGCGKKLDSAAKSAGEKGVFCRECLLLLPASPQGSPTRSPIMPMHTGGKVMPQLTGTTTIARQFTGLGGSDRDAALMRQLTGGSTSPRRVPSPTKGLMRPRPKSVNEGRGMFLIKQLTGTR